MRKELKLEEVVKSLSYLFNTELEALQKDIVIELSRRGVERRLKLQRSIKNAKD